MAEEEADVLTINGVKCYKFKRSKTWNVPTPAKLELGRKHKLENPDLITIDLDKKYANYKFRYNYSRPPVVRVSTARFVSSSSIHGTKVKGKGCHQETNTNTAAEHQQLSAGVAASSAGERKVYWCNRCLKGKGRQETNTDTAAEQQQLSAGVAASSFGERKVHWCNRCLNGKGRQETNTNTAAEQQQLSAATTDA